MPARRTVTLVLTLLLIGGAGGALVRSVLPPSGLTARYYSNTTLSGAPVVAGVDPTPATDVIASQTSGLARFSAEWEGALAVDWPGRFTFALTSDDGSELWVDNGRVVDNGGVHGPQEARGEIELARGLHPIYLRYFQDGGGMALQVRVARHGGELEPLSPSVLVPDGVSYAGYLLRRVAPVGGASVAMALFVLTGPKGARGAGRWRTLGAARVVAGALAAIERPQVSVAVIVVLGALARLLIMAGSGAILWPDSDIYVFTAEQILQGEPLAHEPFRTPVYPYFLTAFLRWGETPAAGTAIVAVQHALGLASALLFYRAGLKAFGGRAAFFATLVFSLHPLLLFYEASVLTEALFVFALSLLVFFAPGLFRAPTVGRALVAGALCALLALVRPVAQGVALAVAVPLWCASLRPRRAAALTALVGAANLVCLLPWMAINQREYGFFGIATGRGLGLFTRVFEIDRLPAVAATRFPDVAGAYDPVKSRPTGVAYLVLGHLQTELRYATRESDEAMYGFALEAVRAHPVRFAWNSLRQWARQLGSTFGDIRACGSMAGPYPCSGRMIGEGRPAFPDAAARGWPPLRRQVVRYLSAAQVRTEIVFPLALLGLVTFLLDGDRPAGTRATGLMLALMAAYLTLVPALTQWPTDRYRLPADAALFLFAARGVKEGLSAWRPEGLRA